MPIFSYNLSALPEPLTELRPWTRLGASAPDPLSEPPTFRHRVTPLSVSVQCTLENGYLLVLVIVILCFIENTFFILPSGE